jgi:hypothetical protein
VPLPLQRTLGEGKGKKLAHDDFLRTRLRGPLCCGEDLSLEAGSAWRKLVIPIPMQPGRKTESELRTDNKGDILLFVCGSESLTNR